ncbi:MAG: DUF4326 domain-containing protein [Ardenticatenaceae bacterium]
MRRSRCIECVRHASVATWKQICADNQQVLDKLRQVTPSTTLICWCAPKRCHCEIISRAADWLRRQAR